MRVRTTIIITASIVVIGAAAARPLFQRPAIVAVDEQALREYEGVYQWAPNAFMYLQRWRELTPKVQLTAFDESGDVRTLYPTAAGRFFAGPGAAVPSSIESTIEFQRDGGRVVSLTWQTGGAPPRTAKRVDIEAHEDVAFSNGNVRLAGTLITPRTARTTRNPAIVLVHGSGAASREWMMPFARFLVRHGIAILGYDKRGVGQSTGDWKLASFDDLAGDALAAFEYLKTRPDIDGARIGLLGVSQAGWIMPIAAVREPGIAFLISVSGAGIPAAETSVDQIRNELTANGTPKQNIDQFMNIMELQYRFARTGEGWEDYATTRAKLVARFGTAPDSFPETPDHPHWGFIRRLYFYDPGPTLRRLKTPTLGLFGELDNNIVADKNKAAWEAALGASGNRDYTLLILPKANHLQMEANIGSNAEMPSLRRFVPAYARSVTEWLAARVGPR